MAMLGAMDDVVYERMNFNFDYKQFRHPKWITERHFVYHLCRDDRGYLMCVRDNKGEPIRSPRKLRNICIYRLVSECSVLTKTDAGVLPSNVYPRLLSEAIFLREPQAIEWAVSTWPMRVLRVYDVLPLEDTVDDDYLTVPFDSNDEVSLADCFVLGLLKLQPESNLRLVDFTKFEKDRKLCKELCRLPILWMNPADRTVEKIHGYLSEILDVTKDKVQCFLNRISAVYSNIDSEFIHGNQIGPITILLDLHVSIDDVPIGLSLQRYGPFKYSCNRLWIKPITDVDLPLSAVESVLDTNMIRSLEYENAMLSSEEMRLAGLMETVRSLRNLTVLSLPDCIDVGASQTVAADLNACLKALPVLRRLNLSYCNVRNRLGVVLDSVRQRLVYVNLKDSRLTEDDLFFLASWRTLAGLRELNLSCNDLQHLDQVVIAMLERMPHITCLSISFCSLSVSSQVLIARECKECSFLKVLCLQGYTPAPHDDMVQLLHICSQIPSLQKAVLFPESYAFPGNVEEEREANKYHTLRFSYRYLELRGRPDIMLE